MSIRVSNIQKFSLDDGPGIRTTVFLKGCFLRCKWCCNPECIEYKKDIFFDKSKCIKKGGRCFADNNCSYLKTGIIDKNKISHNCPAIEIVGADYSVNELLSIILKDKPFYLNNGGVTFSGGEVLLQSYELLDLLKKLKKLKINIAFETSLTGPLQNLKRIIKFVDLFYVDIKIIVPSRAMKLANLNVSRYINSLEYLTKNFNRDKIIIRMPIIPGYNDDIENLKLVKRVLIKNKIKHVEIFSVHNLGISKYVKLKRDYIKFDVANNRKMNDVLSFLSSRLYSIKIVKF